MSYHRHLCTTCKPPARWSCGGPYNIRGPCPGFTNDPRSRSQKAINAPHPWHVPPLDYTQPPWTEPEEVTP